MTDGHARRLLALAAPSMVDADHKRARLLLLRTEWQNPQEAALALTALAELTKIDITIWETATADERLRYSA